MQTRRLTQLLNCLLVGSLATGGALYWNMSKAIATPNLQIFPLGWNVIGLDSNKVTVGPNQFLNGVRVCNTGTSAATNVTATFVKNGGSNYISLVNNINTLSVASLPAGSTAVAPGNVSTTIPSNCYDFYFNTLVQRNTAAYSTLSNAATRQQFHIDVTATGVSTLRTPANRELYVEQLVSQNRNGVTSITGPSQVYAGDIVQYTVNGFTATNGYEQLAFQPILPVFFQLLGVSTTYSTPTGAINNSTYADACGWENNTTSVNYHNNGSCIGPAGYPGGKVGNNVTTTYTIKVLGTGSGALTNVIYDYSGSSYHYNSDLGTGVNSFSVTALPANADVATTITGPTTAAVGSTITYTITATNNGPSSSSNVVVTDNIGPNLTNVVVSNGGTYNPATGIVTFPAIDYFASGASQTYTVSFTAPSLTSVTSTVSSTSATSDPTATNNNGTATNAKVTTLLYTSLSGTVFNDADGSKLQNGSEAGTNGGGLNAVLVDSANKVVASTAVAANGTYSFSSVPANANYTVLITTNTATVGAAPPAIALPSNWVSTGENLNGTIDSTSDGQLSVSTATSTVGAANFGIEQRPTAVGGTATAQLNPTGTNTASVASALFTGSTDPDGTVVSYKITAFPTNATSITINGTNYTAASFPASGVTITAAQLAGMTVDPVDGAVTVGISFQAIDNAGQLSSNTATVLLPFTVPADLTLAKSHMGNFAVGSTGTYTLTVGNSGEAATSGTITVTDTLPAGLTIPDGPVTLSGTNAANWSATASNNVITATSTTAISASGSSTFSFPVSVGLGTAIGTNSVTNTASVSGGGETNTTNNSASDPTTVLSPDLTIAKSHTGNFTRGSTGAYTLTVSNGGTAATSGTITVTDTLPTGLSVSAGTVALSGTNAANWTCTASGQTITCTSTTAIAASGSSTFSFDVNVASNAAASVTNSVAVSGGNEATANTGNNTATDPTTTVAPADLTLSKSHTGSFTVGSTGTYALTVSNTGGIATTGTITVSDPLPAGLTIPDGPVTHSGTNAANWSATASNNVITATSTTAIAASGSSTFSFPVSVGLGTAIGTNSVTNTASVSGGGETNTTNNSASDPTTVLSPDLTIAKSHTGNFTRGSTGAYTLTVNNGGTAATSGTITVTDSLPTGLSVPNGTVALSGANAANWTCTASNNVITCTSTTAIATSGSSTFTFNVNVASNAAASVTNSVTVSGGNEATANTGNNTATDPTTTVAPADLTLSKSHTGSFTVGSTGTYTLTVGNSGGAATSGTITVTDTLPAGLTIPDGPVTLSGTNAANWSATASNNVITATSTTAISASGSSTFSFPVSVGLGTAIGTNSVTNTASVSGGGETNTTNNSASDPTTVLSPDLTITKSHSGNFLRGSTGAYTLTVSNGGTAATSGTITVTDTLPTGLSVPNGTVTLSGTNAANWTCTANNNVITCTSTTTLAISGSSTFSFNVNVASNAAASVTNSVTVSGGNEATANTGNNTATDPTTTVTPQVVVSGLVFNDADGNQTQDSGEGLFSGTTLNAVLTDVNTNLVVATTTVINGAYSFSNVPANANYTVLITTNTATVGAAPPAIALPTNWVSTGETLNGTPDGTIDGRLNVSVATSNVTNANFGIEQLPDTTAVTGTAQNNPGGTTQLQVPTLSGTDPEDGALGPGKTFKIVTLPSNGTLYYNGSAVTAGQTISNYNPTLLTLDPDDGSVTVTFTYAAVDGANQADTTPATVSLSFLKPANVLLVKRITAVNGDRTQNPNDGTPLNQVVDDTTSARQADDNNANWPSNYLLGAINAGKVKPGDTLEYTIYFLNAGSSGANTVRICDRITGVQTFLSNAYGTGQDIQLKIGTGSIVNLTQATDSSDRVQFFATSSSAPASCNLKPLASGIADNGTWVFDLTGSGNSVQPDLPTLPGSTGPGTPTNAYGWIRFQTKVQE